MRGYGDDAKPLHHDSRTVQWLGVPAGIIR
jgi:hypothetical protein